VMNNSNQNVLKASSNNNIVQSNNIQNAPPKIKQKLMLNCKGVNIIMSTYEECIELEKTLLALYFDSLCGELENWSVQDQMEASFKSKFRVEFLNQKMEVFEPMVEPTVIDINLQSIPQSLSITIDRLYINITQTFVDALMKTITSITNVLDKEKSKTSILKSSSRVSLKAPDAYYLRNDTGILIYYSISNSPAAVLPIDSEISFSHHYLGATLRLTLDPNYPFIDSLLIDKIGKNRLKMLATKEGPLASCEVTFRNAGKLLSVRSNRIFVNHLLIPIVILIYADQVNNYQTVIEPEQKFPIPLSHLNNTRYSFAPSSDKFHFTEPAVIA